MLRLRGSMSSCARGAIDLEIAQQRLREAEREAGAELRIEARQQAVGGRPRRVESGTCSCRRPTGSS